MSLIYKSLGAAAVILSLVACGTVTKENKWATNIENRVGDTLTDREGLPLTATIYGSQNMLEADSQSSIGDESLVAVEDFDGPKTPILFERGSAQLNSMDKEALEELAQKLKSGDFKEIQVVGYADPQGTESYNEVLSVKRAQSVQKVLSNLGLSKEKISVKGAGELQGVSFEEARAATLKVIR